MTDQTLVTAAVDRARAKRIAREINNATGTTAAFVVVGEFFGARDGEVVVQWGRGEGFRTTTLPPNVASHVVDSVIAWVLA